MMIVLYILCGKSNHSSDEYSLTRILFPTSLNQLIRAVPYVLRAIISTTLPRLGAAILLHMAWQLDSTNLRPDHTDYCTLSP